MLCRGCPELPWTRVFGRASALGPRLARGFRLAFDPHIHVGPRFFRQSMSRSPAWVLRCKTCHTQFGPITGSDRVGQLLDGLARLDCGHTGAEVVSQSL